MFYNQLFFSKIPDHNHVRWILFQYVKLQTLTVHVRFPLSWLENMKLPIIPQTVDSSCERSVLWKNTYIQISILTKIQQNKICEYPRDEQRAWGSKMLSYVLEKLKLRKGSNIWGLQPPPAPCFQCYINLWNIAGKKQKNRREFQYLMRGLYPADDLTFWHLNYCPP